MKLRTFSNLQIALGVSLAVHGVLLMVRFVDPEAFNRVFQDTPLDVILVNARTNQKADHAKAIAQASMAGGGNLERGRATSPLPPALVSMSGQDTEKDQRQQLHDMQNRQALLLAQVKSMLAALPPPDPQRPDPSPDLAERAREQRELVRLLAEIERRIHDENARPKKRYISPSTREAAYAVYYDHMRRAIEEKGTENFPQVDGQKLYGALTMIVTVDHDGSVLSTEVVQSSGLPTLDRRARAIASAAGPFGRFSPAMRRMADQIAVVSRFTFTRDNTLTTRDNAPTSP